MCTSALPNEVRTSDGTSEPPPSRMQLGPSLCAATHRVATDSPRSGTRVRQWRASSPHLTTFRRRRPRVQTPLRSRSPCAAILNIRLVSSTARPYRRCEWRAPLRSRSQSARSHAVWCVPLSRVLRSLGNTQPGLHGAPRSTRIRVVATVFERPWIGALWRADLWPARREQWREMRPMWPASKTGTLSVAVVARHVVMRPEASGSHLLRCSLDWPGDTATPRWCTAAACPEGDAVCGCESLISKWH